jgi:Ca2+-binding EF-hand superfamily protein
MSMMPITTTLAAVALLAGNAVQAAGQSETTSTFQTLDSDANGTISAAEAKANPDLHARWQELDTDKNNQLDTAEFSAFEAGSGEMMEKSKPSGTPRY